MNKTIQLGKINSLKIARDTEFGFFLEPSLSKDEILKLNPNDPYEVLLPNAYITDDMNINDIVEVFVYKDSEDRIVATTDYPKALVDQFAFVEVVDTTSFGAFVDIGLPKDLLVPRNRQKTPFKVGDKRIIRIVEDTQTNRLIGVEKITSFLTNDTKHLKINYEVKVMVIAFTPMGYKVVVDDKYEGMIFKNEVFTKLYVGNVKYGYIKNIRQDGKLDISLQPIGKDNTKDFLENIILDNLKKQDGFISCNYKSDPQTIQKIFGISKKNFKKTLTILEKKKLINITNNGIQLI